jgi:hypothetical protein
MHLGTQFDALTWWMTMKMGVMLMEAAAQRMVGR